MCERTKITYGDKIHISSSIGISIYPKDGRNFEELYKKADDVLYLVKESGRSNFALYGETIDKNIYQSSTSEQIKKTSYIYY
ncbi:MAG: diguanylate cyclase [Treponema sp.]|nr:diguanylate cyclase [Treponema sp.]